LGCVVAYIKAVRDDMNDSWCLADVINVGPIKSKIGKLLGVIRKHETAGTVSFVAEKYVQFVRFRRFRTNLQQRCNRRMLFTLLFQATQ